MGLVVALEYVFPIQKNSTILLEVSLSSAVYLFALHKLRALPLSELRGVITF